MAPMRDTLGLSHLEDVSDRQRARELYEYYQPKDGDLNRQQKGDNRPFPRKIACPDTALTAFCQLVVWRTGADRALISVIDDTTQYFIAESSKSVDLEDTSVHEPGDDIWMGCSAFEKSGRICVKTLEVAPTKGKEYPSFIVNDLSKDSLYNHLPYVAGWPSIRFYAGVPLITKRGIPIGSLLVVSQKPRDDFTKENIHFMGSMATTIMTHMDMARQVEEHRRGMKMSRGLASFVEGRADIAETEMDTPEGEGSKVAGQFETSTALTNGRARASNGSAAAGGHLAKSPAGGVDQKEKEKEYSTAIVAAERDIMSSIDHPPMSRAPDSGSYSIAATSESVHSPAIDLDTPSNDHKSEAQSTKTLFSRAASLIRETFEVDGGCVFFDAQKGFNLVPRPNPNPISRSPLSRYSSYMSNGSSSSAPGESELANVDEVLADDLGFHELGEGMFSRSATDSRKAVEVLGFSTSTSASIHGDEYPIPGHESQSFKPFHQKALHTLLRRYPRGKLWTLDSDVEITSSEEEPEFASNQDDPEQHLKDIERRHMRKARARSDARFLARHFPGVRQLLFVPLWDSARSRWLSGCCVWSTEPTRILSKQVELAFLTAFGNSVMAECSRIDTEIANQKKGDFIGSISHELRSPLHGILASAEFLGEERLSAFVKGLVDTIDSCGRTLLDTINHILDFSKINHFEKTWQKNKRGGAQGRTYDGTAALQRSEIPMMNLFAEVDISVVCEEVVESVFAGHVFQNITAQTFDIVPSTQKRMSDVRTLGLDAKAMAEHLKHSQVPVVLDLKMRNFNFTTQPGAFRRIIMNLLGNALKYTSHGYVHVSLETTDPEPEMLGEDVSRSMVTLTVTDTGKGISNEFLRSKLFTPFTQENSLSSGTGLGLAIVKSIVSLLEGEIAIDSEVGRGTKVKVTLPLLRALPRFAEKPSPKSVASLSRIPDQSIDALRTRVVGQTVSLYGFDLNTPDPAARQMGHALKQSITTFLTDWYGLRVVPSNQNANFVIANDVPPSMATSLAPKLVHQKKNPIVLVLCSHSSRFDRSTPTGTAAKSIGYVAKPVGPLKLARALTQCLDGIPPVVTPSISETHRPAEGAGLNRSFEELSPTLNRAEILDNSRMSADSTNARKAIESPTPGPADTCIEFPFPVEAPVSKVEATIPERRARGLESPPTEELLEMGITPKPAISPTLSVVAPMKDTAKAPCKPRLLLVDDNIINLALLRTYMRKRAYDTVDEAENGLVAVNRFAERADGYDIIFMDISMPILDGFGASRQIRAIEASRRNAAAAEQADALAKSHQGKPTRGEKLGHDISDEEAQKTKTKKKISEPALIIALTGLASTQDQSEALSSGIDLFLTKPVAFREVGKLLDNWEANR